MTQEAVGILDLDMGNLRSVANAVYQHGYDYVWVREPEQVREVPRLIMPGVGSFPTAMGRMIERHLTGAVREFAASGRPLMGLCLGMQLLATSGTEGEATPGLGLIPGRVERLDSSRSVAVPHIGWNSMEVHREHPVLSQIRTGVDFYFVHSYHLTPVREADVIGTSNCGQVFVAGVGSANVVGFQFHPEKSQKNGLQLIDNFCQWDGQC